MRSKNPTYFEALEAFIDNYKTVHGKAPTTYEIAEGTGMSKSNAARYLKVMKEKGLL